MGRWDERGLWVKNGGLSCVIFNARTGECKGFSSLGRSLEVDCERVTGGAGGSCKLMWVSG